MCNSSCVGTQVPASAKTLQLEDLFDPSFSVLVCSAQLALLVLFVLLASAGAVPFSMGPC
jgi:hypothetical protein